MALTKRQEKAVRGVLRAYQVYLDSEDEISGQDALRDALTELSEATGIYEKEEEQG